MRGNIRTGVGLVSVCAALQACGQSDWQPLDPNTGQGTGPNGSNTPVYSGVDDPSQRPAPISGGTLTVLHDGHTAVAADSDRDRVWIVDLPTRALTHTVMLQPGDEPGRVIEGAGGRVHVMLRRGGAVAVIDTQAGTVLERRNVCSSPRGGAFDGNTGFVHVACADGQLVTLSESTGAVVRRLALQPDLRDVVIDQGVVRVSTFRSAQLLTLNADGTATAAPSPNAGTGVPMDSVAWRTITSGANVWMIHQTAESSPVQVPDPHDPSATTQTNPNQGSAYGGGPGCGTAIVGTTLTQYANGVSGTMFSLPSAVLPVDVAASPDGSRIALVAAGNAGIHAMPQLTTFGPDGSGLTPCGFNGGGGEFRGPTPNGGFGTPMAFGNTVTEQPNGQVVAAAFDGANHLIAQTRQPAAIYLVDEHQVVHLPGVDLRDVGHEIFHANTGHGIACASCHPEGSDDGHVWHFSDVGARRTQNLRGGIGTGPFHWGGEIPDFGAIMSTVFRQRMGGPAMESGQTTAIMDWVQAMPVASAASTTPLTDSAARGYALFNDATVGCAGCHNGPTFTNHAIMNVGTTRPPTDGVLQVTSAFKVPPLARIAQRPPYMHDGCAATLRARFTDTSCGGGDQHGHTSQLASTQIDDLVAYLQTL